MNCRAAAALALLSLLSLLSAAVAQEDEPTPLEPVEVQGRRSLLDSDRARLEKLVPCAVDCAAEELPPRKTLAEELLGVLDLPTLNAEPDVDVPLKAPIKARLDDKLP